jgi:HAD superfamily 5'-nucleotidase-like hydrolase
MTQMYEDLWKDVRECVDSCHNDGVIKDQVAVNPSKYIVHDPEIVPMLQHLKQHGKKVFLLTNSLFDYTHVVMNYIEGQKKGDQKDFNWIQLFDLVIVGACKPSFMINDRLSLFRVHIHEDSLGNEDDVPDDADAFLKKGKVFQGGTWQHLHKLMGLSSGDRILYVGDHMYSDILRSKRTLGWRTCLVIPELTSEIFYYKSQRPQALEIVKLRRQQEEIEQRLDALRVAKLTGKTASPAP